MRCAIGAASTRYDAALAGIQHISECAWSSRSEPGQTGHYAFRIGARSKGTYEVQQEECFLDEQEVFGKPHFFRAQGGEVQTSAPVAPALAPDRLYLVNASGLPEFRPVYEAFSQMGFYNLNPVSIRDLQQPDAGLLLNRDGNNLASVLSAMSLGAS